MKASAPPCQRPRVHEDGLESWAVELASAALGRICLAKMGQDCRGPGRSGREDHISRLVFRAAAIVAIFAGKSKGACPHCPDATYGRRPNTWDGCDPICITWNGEHRFRGREFPHRLRSA